MLLVLSGCPMSWGYESGPVSRVPHGFLEQWNEEHWDIRGGPSMGLEETFHANDLTAQALWEEPPE